MSKGFFENYVRWGFNRHGTSRTLPYFYYDNTALVATYLADRFQIEALVPHPDLKPIEAVPGRGIVAIAAFEYRKTDFEPYNEVSISFLVSFKRRPIPGFTAARMLLSRTISTYVWQLPVTTEHARAGGVDLFGYPKFIADIKFEESDQWLTCTLAENGQEIFQLSGKKLPTRSGQRTRYKTYAIENGMPLMADILVNPIAYGDTFDGRAVSLELSSGHKISDTLAEIGLSKRPMVYQFSPHNEAILFPAHNVIMD